MARASLARAVDRAQAIRRRRGFTGLATRAFEKSASRVGSTVDYYRYRSRYPTNVVFIASLPKSGSTWLANMVCSLDGFRRQNPVRWRPTSRGTRTHDLYPGMLQEFRRSLAVVKGHTAGTADNVALLAEEDLRYVITVRDPRDQLISAYWYLRKDRTHPNHQYASSVDLDEWLRLESDVSSAREHPGPWLRAWMNARDPDRSILVRYEDLLGDTSVMLARVLDLFGFDVTDIETEAIAAAHSFERVTGRTPGDQDTTSFVRRGSPGEWRDVFTEAARHAFAASCEDLVLALGYDPTI